VRKAAPSHWLSAFGLSFAGPTVLHYRETPPLPTAEQNRGVYAARVRPIAKGQMLTAAFPIFCLQVPRAQDFAGENFRRPNGIKILCGTPQGGYRRHSLLALRQKPMLPPSPANGERRMAKSRSLAPNEGARDDKFISMEHSYQ